MKKLKKVLSKEQKILLISLLIGDGTISSNYVFKLSHSNKQREYLNWKIQLLNNLNIKNNGLKEYISSCGYNKGSDVIYTQLSINSTIKALRKSVYVPKKRFTRNLLNWLDARGIAIWYMDDGFININKSIKRHGSIQRTIKISTCVDKETCEMMIEYFKEKWEIEFRPFIEKSNMYSLATRTNDDTDKFIKIVKPYIEEVPSLLYKIRNCSTKENFIKNSSKCETL